MMISAISLPHHMLACLKRGLSGFTSFIKATYRCRSSRRIQAWLFGAGDGPSCGDRSRTSAFLRSNPSHSAGSSCPSIVMGAVRRWAVHSARSLADLRAIVMCSCVSTLWRTGQVARSSSSYKPIFATGIWSKPIAPRTGESGRIEKSPFPGSANPGSSPSQLCSIVDRPLVTGAIRRKS